jgi:hypothetical protein
MRYVHSGVSEVMVILSGCLLASACKPTLINQGSVSLGTNVAGANGTLSATIPAAYYDGTTSCTMSDSNLTSGNISSSLRGNGWVFNSQSGPFTTTFHYSSYAVRCVGRP